MPSRYEHIADDLRRRITEGEFPSGSKLPGYDALLGEYQASRQTVRHALSLLQQEGRVRPVKKLGLVVREAGERHQLRLDAQVSRDATGYLFPTAAPKKPWITHGRPREAMAPVPAAVAQHLGLEPGTETLRHRHVTSPEGEDPFRLCDSWIHPAVADAPGIARSSPGPAGHTDAIEAQGHGPLDWTRVIRCRTATPEEARLLKLPAAVSVIEVTTIGTSARTGAAVDATVEVFPGDRIEVVSPLKRDRAARWPVTSPSPR